MSFALWNFMETVFPIAFVILFFFVIAVFVTVMVQGLTQWNKNNHSPRLTVEATVVAKRQDINHHHQNHSNGHMGSSTSTSYYVTFQVESGDRMELPMSGREYGILVEGDRGRLSFQGTRYLGFEIT
ncbi:MAG: DUF2500 domain-containing protein [bacterium]|nr:DUF2500 domain-containing protein [bacterium]